MANCIERIREIAKGNFSKEETSRILKDIERDLGEREGLAEESGAVLQDVINSSTANLEKSVEQENFLLAQEELQVARSANLYKGFEKFERKPLERFGDALTMGTTRGAKGAGARTLLTHTNHMRMSGRINLDDAIRSVKDGMQVLKSSQHEIAVLDAINGDEGANKIANDVGKNIAEFRETNNKRLEKHGIVTRRLENRGIYQSHDATKMLMTADSLADRTRIRASNLKAIDRARIFKDISLERWSSFIDPLLDLKKTFGDKTALNEKAKDDIYREIFDTITSDATSLGKKSIQSQVDSSRFFHFKNSSSQLRYNSKFGTGTLFDSLMQEADSTWNRIATLEMAGNRPLNYIDKTIRLAAKNAKRKFTKDEVNKAVAESQYKMQQTLGISTRVQGLSGKLTAAIKLALLAKIAPTLGPLVAITDAAPAINVMTQLGGKGIFRSTIKLFGIARKILGNEEDLKSYTEAMGFRRDIQMGSIHKFSGIENANLRGKLASFMMKLSPHEFMNYVEGLSTSHEITLMLGQQSKVGFDKLPGKLSKVLDLYGIEGDRWNLMRKGTTEVGGTTHITSDALRKLPTEDIKKFLKKKFNLKKVSDFRVEQERAQTQQLFTQMIADKMAAGSNLVDARERGTWSLRFDTSTARGRAAANLFSIFGSLRYYETAIVHRTLAPLIYGESGESAIHQILGMKFDKIGMARWVAISATLGMMGFTLQELMKGRTPDLKEMATRSILSPLGVIGQGLEVGKGFGHDAASAAMGPGFNMLFRSITNLAKVLRGEHPVRNATNFVTTAVPGFNNSISRHAIHHLMQNQFGNMYRG